MSDPTVQRRLAAILSADVVGYSRLMGVDEVGTLAALKAHRAELMDPKIAAHAGRIVKTAGDGFLVEFPSIIEAVECAVDLQISTDSRNADIPEERQLRFRIGINVGDVIVEDGDIFGDGVNVAARLQEIAEPGEVYISRSARDQVRDKLDMPLEDLGEHEVKNIARPVRVFRVGRNDGSSPARPAAPSSVAPAAATHPPDQQSIAVLPFENMSGDQEQEYFADGIAEDIITSLSKISGLFVIARNSTFTYKGQSVNVQEVSQALGVRNVLEGSVRKAGNRVRIAQVVGDTEAGCREGLKSEMSKQASGARVLEVGNDECALTLMKCAESSGFFYLIGHRRAHPCAAYLEAFVRVYLCNLCASSHDVNGFRSGTIRNSRLIIRGDRVSQFQSVSVEQSQAMPRARGRRETAPAPAQTTLL